MWSRVRWRCRRRDVVGMSACAPSSRTPTVHARAREPAAAARHGEPRAEGQVLLGAGWDLEAADYPVPPVMLDAALSPSAALPAARRRLAALTTCHLSSSLLCSCAAQS